MLTKLDNRHQIELENPNICSHCHVTNIPKNMWHIQTNDTDNSTCFLSAWKCSNKSCSKIFIIRHKNIDGHYAIEAYLNGYPKSPEWPKPILELKDGSLENKELQNITRFIEIYNQCLKAENLGLNEIAGMGYRKAIEYLVKDIAISKNEKEHQNIVNLPLGKVIHDFFEGDLRDLLKRANWLGTDETHYVKIFQEFDINTLKELIDLIMVELDREYKKMRYINSINKNSNK